MKAAYEKARINYLQALEGTHGSILEPSRNLSKVSKNGTVFLRNTNGLLAVVTSTGMVFDRIGGTRLDSELVATAEGRA